jgi:hypothetical protein
MMSSAAGDETPVEGAEGRTVTEYGRIRRDVRRRFKAEHQLRDRIDQAAARPAPPRGQRLPAEVAGAFADHAAGERAEAEAQSLALETVAELAAHYRALDEADPASGGVDVVGVVFGDSPGQRDPLSDLLDAVEESRRPEFGPAALVVLAQIAAAAVLQLGKDHGRPAGQVVDALLNAYFPDGAGD